MLYGTAWWDTILGGAVAASLLISARTLLGRYRRSLDDPGEEPRQILARDVAIFVAGQSLCFVAAIPLAIEIGSAVVFAVIGFYVLTRVLLITGMRWLQRRGRIDQTPTCS